MRTQRKVQLRDAPNSDLDQLSIEDLIALRDSIESILSDRVAAEKSALQAKLAELERFAASVKLNRTPAGHAVSRKQKRSKPVPKYRNPSSGETWAGRGLKPRWMVQALKKGARIEDFLIQTPQLIASAA